MFLAVAAVVRRLHNTLVTYCGIYETYSIISLVIVCVYCDWLCYTCIYWQLRGN